MNEKLLQFIWQYQYFQNKDLHTIHGEHVQVIMPGKLNTEQGPDFSNARIKLDATEWAGNIELHINTSDWLLHRHDTDKNYENVILHVVWEHDEIHIKNNSLPVLELKPLVSRMMLQRYEQLMQQQKQLPCSNFLPVLSELGWLAWKERLTAERLQRKANDILNLYERSKHHWETVCWWLIAKSFGMKSNGEVFEQVAKTVDINILAKHKNQAIQIEALLLGQAGLLNKDFDDDYAKLLQREYNFLSKKYRLQQVNRSPDFLRMRPANFPTLRLSQLAQLVSNASHLFSKIIEAENATALIQLFNVCANDYWHYHYIFDEQTPYKEKWLGKTITHHILINTAAPLIFAYGQHHNKSTYTQKAIAILNDLPPEENNITRNWKRNNISNKKAFDSQALIELTNSYCNHLYCLKCAVGVRLLRNE